MDTSVVICIIGLFVGITSARMDEYSANCTALCTQEDSDDGCWNSTLDYASGKLVNALRDYTIVQIAVDQWKWRHVDGYNGTDKARLLASAVFQLNKKRTSGDLLPAAAVTAAASALVDVVVDKSKEKLVAPPLFHCPVACGYEGSLYAYLLIASAILNVALLLSVVPAIVRMERRGGKVPYVQQHES